MESSDLLIPAALPSGLEFSMISCDILSARFFFTEKEDEPFVVFDKESARGIVEEFFLEELISEAENIWFLGVISSSPLPESFNPLLQKRSLRGVSETVFSEFSNFPGDMEYFEEDISGCVEAAHRCRIN